MFGVALLELVAPKVIGIVVDEINDGTLTTDKLLKWVVLLVIVGIDVHITLHMAYYDFRVFIKISSPITKNLYEHFTKMSPSFYQSNRTGDLMAHATNDIQQQTAGAGVLTLVDSLAVGGCVLVAMGFTISWKLTLLSLIPMPIVAISTNYYGTLLHKRFHKAQQSFSEINDKVQESMSGMKVIRSLGQEKEDLQAFRRKSEDVVHKMC